MTPERKKELDVQYAKAVLGKSQEDTRYEWLKYLTVLYYEEGGYQVFLEIRSVARSNGAALAIQYRKGFKTAKQFYSGIQQDCANVYTSALNSHGITDIDMSGAVYKAITEDTALEALKAFDGVDSEDKTAICEAMAIIWHRFVERLHTEFKLPSVVNMKGTTRWDSDIEKIVLDRNDFETKMTVDEKTEWENIIDPVGIQKS